MRDYLFDARTGYYLSDMPAGWAWGSAELDPRSHTIIRTAALRLPNGEIVGKVRSEPLTLPGGIVIPAGIVPTVRPLQLRLFRLAQALDYSGQDNIFNDAALAICQEAEGIVPAQFVNLGTGASYSTENDMWGSVSDGSGVLMLGWGDDTNRPLWAIRIIKVALRQAQYQRVASVEEATRWLATGDTQPPPEAPPTVIVLEPRYINLRTGQEYATDSAMWAEAQGGDGVLFLGAGADEDMPVQALRLLGVAARKAEVHLAENRAAAEQWLATNGLTPRYFCLRTGLDVWSEDELWGMAQDGDGFVLFQKGPSAAQPIRVWAFKVLDADAKKADIAAAASMEAAEQYLATYVATEKFVNLRSEIEFSIEDNMWADAEDGDGVVYTGRGSSLALPTVAIRIISAANREAERHWVANREEAEQWLS